MKSIKLILLAATVAIGLGHAAASAAAQPLGSEFTYQGQLKLSGTPLNDTADFEFTLWDADGDGDMIGSVWPVNNVNVVDGLFTVTIDFGVEAFNGEARWLEIALRSPSGKGDFTTLDPRQPLTATPYALQTRGIFVDEAGNVGIGTTNPQGLLQVGEGTFIVISDPDNPTCSLVGIGDLTPDAKLEVAGCGASDFLMLSSAEDLDGNLVIVKNDGKVGINKLDPEARLHVHEDIVDAGDSAVRVTFSSLVGAIGTRGINVVSTPLDIGTGSQYGVFANTSKTGGPDPQKGAAEGRLARSSGFFAGGAFHGVEGISRPKVLSNFNDTTTSSGLGGSFIAAPDDTLILDSTGTYWVGGVYGEVAGDINGTPTLGAVAGVIGVDSNIGTAESYAGYFDGKVVVKMLPNGGKFNVTVDDNGVLNKGDLGGLVDDDWDITNSPDMVAIPAGNVGIGITAPDAKFHVHELIDVAEDSAVRVTFGNLVGAIGTRGINVVSTPLDVGGTGSQHGIIATTSKIGGPDPQLGAATGRLATSAGFFSGGNFSGVTGISRPNALGNFNETTTSRGLGGHFVATPDAGLTLDATGTYWVGGVYGEVAGDINGTPTLGAVAGVIGVDSNTGTAQSYAGYFDGKVVVKVLPAGGTDIVTVDSTGLLHRGAGLADDDWQRNSPNGPMFPIHLGDHVGIGTNAPSTRLHVNNNFGPEGLATFTYGAGAQVIGDAGVKIGTAWNVRHGLSIRTSNNSIGDPDHASLWIENVGRGGLVFYAGDTANDPTPFVIDHDGDVGIGRLPTNNRLEVEGEASKTTAGSWLANSDRRIKQRVETIEGALETLDKVRLVSFEYTDAYRQAHSGVDSRRYMNVIAQEFAEVFPEHVKGSGEYLPDGSEILQVDTYPLIIYSSAAIQELHAKSRGKTAQIASLEDEIAELREEKDSEIQALADRLAELEGLVEELAATKGVTRLSPAK